MFLRFQQGVRDAIVGSGDGFDRGIGAGFDGDIAGPVDQLVELDRSRLVLRGHAMIGHNDDIGRNAQRRHPVKHFADPSIDIGNSRIHFGAVDAETMPFGVDRVEIERDQSRTDRRRSPHPVKDRMLLIFWSNRSQSSGRVS